MAHFIGRRPWHIPENAVTPERIFRERRQLLKAAGFLGLGLVGIIPTACGPARNAATIGAQENPPGSGSRIYMLRFEDREWTIDDGDLPSSIFGFLIACCRAELNQPLQRLCQNLDVLDSRAVPHQADAPNFSFERT